MMSVPKEENNINSLLLTGASEEMSVKNHLLCKMLLQNVGGEWMTCFLGGKKAASFKYEKHIKVCGLYK